MHTLRRKKNIYIFFFFNCWAIEKDNKGKYYLFWQYLEIIAETNYPEGAVEYVQNNVNDNRYKRLTV